MKTTLILEQDPTGEGTIVRALLRLEGEAPESTNRAPLNLSLVLDRSGSMSGEPLEAARRAAIGLVRRLDPTDVVSVVAYGSRVETVAEPATGSEQPQLGARIESIRTEGMTNLSGGWLRGQELVLQRRREGGVNRVLLLTDGQANEGITDPETLAGLCRSAAEQGLSTSTIGFGAKYNEHLLRMMADAGGGSTYYIERADQAADVFAQEIEGLLSLSAQNVRVWVQPAPAAELTVVHHAYARQPTPEGLRLELGDLYAREPRTLLAEFLVRDDAAGTDIEVAELVVRGDVLRADGGMERREVRLKVRVAEGGGAVTQPEVRRELLLLEAARVREQALEDRRRGDMDGVGMRLRETAARLATAAAGTAEREVLDEEAQDLSAMAERFDRDLVTEADAKYLYQRSYATAQSKRGTAASIRRRPDGGHGPSLAPDGSE
jgi:Ca-activated chloride channel homolog